MTKKEFTERVLKEIEGAKEDLYDEKNVLDLRVARYPYKVNEDNDIYACSDIDDAYEFVKDAEEWYVDVYENLYGKNEAVYTGFCVCSWA
jgi:hypothetical protein